MRLLNNLTDRLPTIAGVSASIWFPVALTTVGLVVSGLASGQFNTPEIVGGIATLIFLFTGYVVPPAPGVRQHEINRLSEDRKKHRKRSIKPPRR